MNKHHRAPLPRWLAFYTGAVVLCCLVFAAAEARAGNLVSALGLIGIILLGYALSVQGYSVGGGTLFIHRGGWAHTVDLGRLRHVEVSPDAMIGSASLWSTRGYFGIAGRMRNATLGHYRAYATDQRKAVVLEVGDERLVVTPEQPEAFAAAVRAARARQPDVQPAHRLTRRAPT